MSGGNLWHSGGHGDSHTAVENRYKFGSVSKQGIPRAYQWIVQRTAIGIPDPLAGKCVLYNDNVFLGISQVQNKWLRKILFAAIIYIMDILYCVIKLSQYNTKPTKIYYMDVKCVFR